MRDRQLIGRLLPVNGPDIAADPQPRAGAVPHRAFGRDMAAKSADTSSWCTLSTAAASVRR